MRRRTLLSEGDGSFPVGTVMDFAYTGSYQEVELPKGSYKLQCWGAQGGSNASASSYSITAKSGGKGGYSEGIITIPQKTTVRVYVGGKGSSSSGGYNGGGSTTGSSSYSTGTSGQAGYVYGTSRMGGGGGATDIRLSDGSLYSRIIVAGGGSGGAMCYKKYSEETLSQTSYSNIGTWTFTGSGSTSGDWGRSEYYEPSNVAQLYLYYSYLDTLGVKKIRITATPRTSSNYLRCELCNMNTYNYSSASSTSSSTASLTWSLPSVSNNSIYAARIKVSYSSGNNWQGTIKVEKVIETYSISTNTSTNYQAGGVGGGTSGGGYSSSYYGTQSAAGSGGSFGQGANQTITGYRYCSGAGGGGWYGGGGGKYSDSSMTYCKYSGGGSGFVNTAANSSYRPSEYTGLQLDSGTTYAGNTSFTSISGSTETGHSGNGYARITRLT